LNPFSPVSSIRLLSTHAASVKFEYGAALTEIGLLGLVAMRTRKKIYWNAQAMRCDNASEAYKFLKETYRPDWEVA
jgi:hypothetical protein